MIQIKNPCDASWKEMTPAESGKYCSACEKVVVDFSKMNDAEIKNYFITYKDQKTCGRFLDSQLQRPLIVSTSTTFNTFLNRLNQIPVTRTVMLFLTSISVWISSCVNNKTTGELDLADTTEKYNTPLMEDTMAVIKPHDSLLIKPNRDTFEMGEVAPRQSIKIVSPHDFLIGDVVLDPLSNQPDTVAFMIPAISPDTTDITLNMMMGKVKMVDTISQKVKRKK
ncbi:MAG TPA: hypothetical protein VK796_11295 [Cytophaga sp.]|jgi:hypothetical protein|nr:hypothetical protein [Cytophaga sp.]